MKEEARAARRAEIETATYALLAEKGYASTSILAVARRAKASNETLYNWYGDKAGLIEAMVRANAQEIRRLLEAALEDETNPCAALATAAPVLLRLLTGERAIALNRAATADASGALGLLLTRSGRDTIAPLLRKLIESALQEGTLQGEAGDLTELYLSLLVGDLQIRRVLGALPPLTEAKIADRANRAVARFFQLTAA